MKKLEELNVIDDFLFCELISGAKGKWFCKLLIKAICGKEVENIQITPQNIIQVADTVGHGIRMDLLVDDTDGCLYDFEPDCYTSIKELPKRARYYHSLTDSKLLDSGIRYENLRDLWIIFILPHDPFGEEKMCYTFRMMCEEMSDLPYEDGARTIFLNTKGTAGTNEQLLELLKYIESSTDENAVSEELQELHNYVGEIKQKKEVGVRYMKSWERDHMMFERGRLEGEKLGEQRGKQEVITNMLKKNQSPEEISEWTNTSLEYVYQVESEMLQCLREEQEYKTEE